MMLGSQCSQCCGPTCESLESRLPHQLTTNITQMAVDLFGNDAQCQSSLLASEPFSFWYSRPLSAVGPFFPAAVPRDESSDRRCVNCRWRVDFPFATGDFFAGDFFRFDFDCSVVSGELFLLMSAAARIRGQEFFSPSSLIADPLLPLSVNQLESATMLIGLMVTQSTGCRGVADIEVAWPGLNPLP